MNRLRVPAAVLALILLPAGLGIVAVHASATCARFVHTYVSVPVHNKVSKATALAWAKWRQEHPAWKPNPNVHRPKYVMSRQEMIRKVAFACQVPPTPDDTNLFFKPADFEPPPHLRTIPPMDTTQIVFPGGIPPQVMAGPPLYTVAQNTPPPLGGLPPLIPPPYLPPPAVITSGTPPPEVAPVPEPPTFLLSMLGLLSIGLLWRRRVDRNTETAMVRIEKI